MTTKMVCDVQGTKWVCDKCGFGWVASEVLNCKVCTLEADLELARKERRADLGSLIAKSNKIIELASDLKSSEEIRRAEKEILINEIKMNKKLRSQIEGLKIELQVLKKATAEVVRISDREHDAWTKLKLMLKET